MSRRRRIMIDRVVVRGTRLDAHDAASLQQVVAAEVRRRLGGPGSDPPPAAGVHSRSSPQEVGSAIAAQVTEAGRGG